MAKATGEDAKLLVQLAQLGVQADLGRASNWIWSDDFASDYDDLKQKYPPGSEEFGYVMTVARYYETVATLWKHELIDEGLLFDWLSVQGLWNRLKDVLHAQREEMGEPRLWENFEALAEANVPAPA